ncbi:unannotated protein [freshwater metagenome]|uniref:Unannotated protein n=1 Tax=freshwater metagenome TaxID=449393 RepID=A0A6J7HGE1_9ZZZZ|nr:1-acyl-sn-glycerol-3-phosphate acyltransferase [Actinomycetota bacterium]
MTDDDTQHDEQREAEAAGLVRIREQAYVDERSADALQRYYDTPMRRPPGLMYTVVRVVLSIVAWTFFRSRALDVDRIPATGPVIFAPNHFSNIDHFFVASYTRRKVQFMAKSQLYKGPFAEVMRRGGVFPVQRGRADEQSFEIARRILARGGSVCIYSEGGRSRTGRLADKPKRGVGRIALESGAAVVPVAIHGSQRARNWKRLQFPRVAVRFGDPIRWDVIAEPTREQQQAVADEIFAQIRALYATLDED